MSTRQDVLEALRASDDYLSGEALARELGVTRAAVWKHIAALKRDGHVIEGMRRRGYRLFGSAGTGRRPAYAPIDAESLRRSLDSRRLGCRLVVHEVTGSTNTDATALAEDGAAEGTLVIAEEQTAGRGRLGRRWESEPGLNLYMSLLLRPRIAMAEVPLLSLLAGLAVSAAARDEGIEAGIKWPNDVVVGRRKLAGVLTEAGDSEDGPYVVVGMGVNCNAEREHFPDELRDKATSLLIERGHRVDRTAFVARLLACFEERYERFQAAGFPSVAAEWDERSVLAGRRVEVSGAGESLAGRCTGIDRDGALLLDVGADVRRVLAGDVTVVGGYA